MWENDEKSTNKNTIGKYDAQRTRIYSLHILIGLLEKCNRPTHFFAEKNTQKYLFSPFSWNYHPEMGVFEGFSWECRHFAVLGPRASRPHEP